MIAPLNVLPGFVTAPNPKPASDASVDIARIRIYTKMGRPSNDSKNAIAGTARIDALTRNLFPIPGLWFATSLTDGQGRRMMTVHAGKGSLKGPSPHWQIMYEGKGEGRKQCICICLGRSAKLST